MGERYGLKAYKSNTRVYIDEALSYADNTMIVPERINYASIGFWGEYTHNGMLYIFTPDEDKMSTIVEVAREISEKSAQAQSGFTDHLCARHDGRYPL